MTEKKYTQEEIIKLVEEKSNYGYYPNNKYENPFEKLHQKALNCSDRDKLPPEIKRKDKLICGMPPRSGKTSRQEFQICLQDYKIELETPTEILKGELDPSKDNFEDLLKKIINKATLQLVNAMKKEYPEYPDEILAAFVTQFLDIEITNDYDFRTREPSFIIIPTWKDVNMIDFNSEEQKLLDNYFMG